MCGGIASCYFNHLVTLFKQKQSPSACISLKTKDCFMFSVLFLRLFFFFGKIMHYAIMNNCSFCCIIGIFGTIGTKVFKLQDWFTEIFSFQANRNLHHFLYVPSSEITASNRSMNDVYMIWCTLRVKVEAL